MPSRASQTSLNAVATQTLQPLGAGQKNTFSWLGVDVAGWLVFIPHPASQSSCSCLWAVVRCLEPALRDHTCEGPAAELPRRLGCWSWCGEEVLVLDSGRCPWLTTGHTNRVKWWRWFVVTGWIAVARGSGGSELRSLSSAQPKPVSCLWSRCNWNLFLGVGSERPHVPSARQGWNGCGKCYWTGPTAHPNLPAVQCFSSIPPGLYILLHISQSKSLFYRCLPICRVLLTSVGHGSWAKLGRDSGVCRANSMQLPKWNWWGKKKILRRELAM